MLLPPDLTSALRRVTDKTPEQQARPALIPKGSVLITSDHFAWDNSNRSFGDFHDLGQEANGTADTLVTAHVWSCDMVW